MQNPDKDSEYQKELKKLVKQKIVSEKTAQIHLSQINKQPKSVATNAANSNKFVHTRKSSFSFGKILLGIVALCIFLLIAVVIR
jgi:hypothetical protein